MEVFFMRSSLLIDVSARHRDTKLRAWFLSGPDFN
jgi:hypothetical protein